MTFFLFLLCLSTELNAKDWMSSQAGGSWSKNMSSMWLHSHSPQFDWLIRAHVSGEDLSLGYRQFFIPNNFLTLARLNVLQGNMHLFQDDHKKVSFLVKVIKTHCPCAE